MKYLMAIIALAFSFMFNAVRSLCGFMPLEVEADDYTEITSEKNFPHLSENGGGAVCDHLGTPAAAP